MDSRVRKFLKSRKTEPSWVRLKARTYQREATRSWGSERRFPGTNPWPRCRFRTGHRVPAPSCPVS